MGADLSSVRVWLLDSYLPGQSKEDVVGSLRNASNRTGIVFNHKSLLKQGRHHPSSLQPYSPTGGNGEDFDIPRK